MRDEDVSKRPDVRPHVMRRYWCPLCRVGETRHYEYGAPVCEGAIVTALGIAKDPHPARAMLDIDRRHDEQTAR
jgi:hypothetical protein